jgi:uncharacterized membrane protein
MVYFAGYISALLVLIVGDALWLSFYFAPNIFRPVLQPLLRDPPNWPVAGLFYFLYALGIFIFAINPALKSANWMNALTFGLLFGFMAYMTYDLTNLATLSAWTLKLAVMDTVWGAAMTGAAATAGYLAARAAA